MTDVIEFKIRWYPNRYAKDHPLTESAHRILAMGDGSCHSGQISERDMDIVSWFEDECPALMKAFEDLDCEHDGAIADIQDLLAKCETAGLDVAVIRERWSTAIEARWPTPRDP